MLINREVILAKVESTYNVDPSPVAASDAVLVESITFAPSNVRMVDRQAVRESLGPLKPIYGGRLASIELVVEIKGSGTAGVAPELGTLLRGCGYSEVIVGATSVTYEPASTGQESLTFYYYQDGLLTAITGALGDVKGAIMAGSVGRLTFSFTGHVASPSDTAMIAPTYSTVVPSVLLAVSFTVGGFASKINSFNFESGNEISTPTSLSAADGYGEIRISNRSIKGTMDPEAELVATEAYIADWVSGASAALTTGSIGGTAGNIVNISMPAITYTNVADGARDGIRTYDVAFSAIESSGDDELSFVFT